LGIEALGDCELRNCRRRLRPRLRQQGDQGIANLGIQGLGSKAKALAKASVSVKTSPDKKAEEAGFICLKPQAERSSKSRGPRDGP
jgi:hypothetical protein